MVRKVLEKRPAAERGARGVKGGRARGPPGPPLGRHDQWPRRSVLGEAGAVGGGCAGLSSFRRRGLEPPGLRTGAQEGRAGVGEVLCEGVLTGMRPEAGGGAGLGAEAAGIRRKV